MQLYISFIYSILQDIDYLFITNSNIGLVSNNARPFGMFIMALYIIIFTIDRIRS